VKKKINYKEIVLKTILLTTVLSVAVMAPNALQMFKGIFGEDERPKSTKNKFRLKETTKKLLKSGYIKWSKTHDGKFKLALTQKGMFELLKFKDALIKKPKKWDKRWRVVIFDIPHPKKKQRDILRDRLKAIGFCQLQKSVWIFPYPCNEIIDLIRQYFKFGKEVIYMVVQKVENDKSMVRHFRLKI
jgi:DNA-binding transcriptional regulator PaaX